MASIPKWNPKTRKWRVWWHVTLPGGKVDKGSRTFDTKELALKFKDHCEQNARSIKNQRYHHIYIEAAIKLWLEHCRRLASTTQSLYKMVITEFEKSIEIVDVADLTAADINSYIASILIAGKTNRYANCQLTAIKSFCRWLKESYKIPNAADDIRFLKENPPDVNFLTRDEYDKVLDVAKPRALQVIKFLANTGLRVSELCNLKWSNYDSKTSSITIIGKGRKRRSVGLNSVALSVLNDIDPKDPTTYIFSKSKPLTRHQIYNLLSETSGDAKVRFSAHALRHFFATQLLLAGVPIIKVSALLGHASITTTQRHYSHILSGDLAGICEQLVAPTSMSTQNGRTPGL